MATNDGTREDETGRAGPVTVILGATGGIGSHLARHLAGHGARLVLGARGEERLAELAAELGALPVPVDARDPDAVKAVYDAAVAAHGRVDGAVNCVGSVFLKPAHATSTADWNETLATNLTSAFATIRHAIGPMRKTGGSIVLVSSVAAQLGLPNHEAIAAAKAGVLGLMQSAAATYASKKIRVNAVAPGLIRTPATTRLTENEAARKTSEAMHPLRRIGETSDVVSAITWLLDPAQSWITGQVLGVDGGLSTLRA